MRRSSRDIVVFGSLSAMFLVLCVLCWDFTMDDSFIAYRYSQNLASGHGIVWNVGEDPVEGYTSFSWVVLNALAFLAGIAPATFSKILSVLSALTIFWILARATSHTHWIWAGLLVGMLALSPPFAVLTLQGLETTFAGLLLLLAAWLGLRAWNDPSVPTISAWYAVCLLAAFTRPDTIPFSVGMFLGLGGALVARRDGRATATFLLVGAAFVAIGGLYFVWRLRYFGHPFPNPYYIKMAADALTPAERKADALSYVLSFLGAYLLPYLVLLGFLFWRTGMRWSRVGPTVPILLGCALFGAYLLTIIPIMGYFWRFAFPVVPAFLLASSRWLPDRENGPEFRWALVPVLLVALFAWWHARFLPEAFVVMARESTRNRVLAGEALAGLDGTMFTSASGALPLCSGWRAVDKRGLNSEEIAHEGLSYDLLERLDPDLIILRSGETGQFRRGTLRHAQVTRYMAGSGRYTAITAIHRYNGVHLWYFGNRDSSILPEIARRLRSLPGVEYGDLNELLRAKEFPVWEESQDGPSGRDG